MNNIMRKSLEIRDKKTIIKFEAIQNELNLCAPQIIDRALDSLILSIVEGYKNDLIIHEYITKLIVSK